MKSDKASISRLEHALLQTGMMNRLFVDRIRDGEVSDEYVAEALQNFRDYQDSGGPVKHRYVLGFVFDFDAKKVLLMIKNRPTWQVGLLNGVGGKIEEGETPFEAMEREFVEETYFSSLYHGDTDTAETVQWVPVGERFRSGDYEMFVFAAWFSNIRALDFEMPASFRSPNTSTIWDVPMIPDQAREQLIALPLNREILNSRGVPGLAWTVDASLQALREGFYFAVEDLPNETQ